MCCEVLHYFLFSQRAESQNYRLNKRGKKDRQRKKGTKRKRRRSNERNNTDHYSVA